MQKTDDMTQEKFSALSTTGKWSWITREMALIQYMERSYVIRRRLNPYHPPEQVEEETRRMRTEQYIRWLHVKELYAAHRDELSNTSDDVAFITAKSILERVLAQDFDAELRKVIEE